VKDDDSEMEGASSLEEVLPDNGAARKDPPIAKTVLEEELSRCVW